MGSIRVCYVKIGGMVEERNGRMVGTWSDFVNLALDALRGMNVTFVTELTASFEADSKTGLYDGCIGSMQQNASDYSLYAVYLPVVADNIAIMDVNNVDRDTMLSFYDSSFSGKRKTTDVLVFWKSFSPAVWLIFSAFVIFLACMLFARGVMHDHVRWIRGKKRSKRLLSVRQIRKLLTGCLLKQLSSFMIARNVSGASFITMLLLMLACYSFFYLTSMIKTEAVVFKNPFVISTYTDLLQSGVRPIWASNLDGERFFPHPSLMEQQVMERVEEMGIEKSRMRDEDQVFGHIPAVVRGEEVILTYGSHARNLAKVLCFHLRSNAIHSNRNAWVKNDPQTAENIWIHVARRHFVSESRFRLIQERLHMNFEHSLVTYLGVQNVVTNLPFYQELHRTSPDNIHSKLQECLCNQIIFPDHDVIPLTIHHYRHMFLMLASVLTMITMLHLAQVVHQQYARYWMSQIS